MISLDRVNRREAVRYMGGAKVEMNPAMERLMDDCEARLLNCARPKYLYKIIDLPQDELMQGGDVKKHLDGCTRAALICATLGAETDRLIRVTQINDLAAAEENRAERKRKQPAYPLKVSHGYCGHFRQAHREKTARLRGLQPARNLPIQKER